MVNTSCALLKFSLRTSNVFDGATRVENRSSPYANTSDVDSSSAGDVTIRRVFATCSRKRTSELGGCMRDLAGGTFLVVMRENTLRVVWDDGIVLD